MRPLAAQRAPRASGCWRDRKARTSVVRSQLSWTGSSSSMRHRLTHARCRRGVRRMHALGPKGSRDPVDAVLSFARDTLFQGRGFSIAHQLHRIRYADIRPLLTEERLEARLAWEPALLDQWLQFSDDKRTSGGWYLGKGSGTWIVGRCSRRGAIHTEPESFPAGARACAAYVLRELDFWQDVGRRSSVPTWLLRLFWRD